MSCGLARLRSLVGGSLPGQPLTTGLNTHGGQIHVIALLIFFSAYGVDSER